MGTTKSGHPACSRCHRALKDPVSVKLELGPVCRKKLGVTAPAEPPGIPTALRACARHGTRSTWTYHLDGAFVLVEDLDGGMSVTNDADAVVAALAQDVPLGGRRIVYRDSEGRWDEIVHQDGRFVGFRAIGARTAYDATHYAGAPVKGNQP